MCANVYMHTKKSYVLMYTNQYIYVCNVYICANVYVHTLLLLRMHTYIFKHTYCMLGIHTVCICSSVCKKTKHTRPQFAQLALALSRGDGEPEQA